MALTLPAAVRLGLCSTCFPSFFLFMKNKYAGQPGSRQRGKCWLVVAAAKSLLPPPTTMGPSGRALGRGPGRPDLAHRLGLRRLGPCPQPPSRSGMRHMGRFWVQNLNQAIPEFYSAMWVDAILIPSQCGCEWRPDCWSVGQCRLLICLRIRPTWRLWRGFSLPARWCTSSATPALWLWMDFPVSLGQSICPREVSLCWPPELGMNWHVLWAAESLGGLRGGHGSFSYPSLPRGPGTPRASGSAEPGRKQGLQAKSPTLCREGACCFRPALD